MAPHSLGAHLGRHVRTFDNDFTQRCGLSNVPPTDIARLFGGPGWNTIPVAFSNGDGTWRVTNLPCPDFTSDAVAPGVKVLTGKFM